MMIIIIITNLYVPFSQLSTPKKISSVFQLQNYRPYRLSSTGGRPTQDPIRAALNHFHCETASGQFCTADFMRNI